MKDKHIQIRIEQCISNAKASNCIRLKVGALLLDYNQNIILVDGYNGAPRDGSLLCGKNSCLRDDQKIQSGTLIEIGCHHAEMNIICNAAKNGIATNNSCMLITAEPCLMCSKLIHHAGIKKIIVINGGYSGKNGIDYLKENNVEVEYVSGPTDNRGVKIED